MDLGNLPKGLAEAVLLISTIITTFTGSVSQTPSQVIRSAIYIEPTIVPTEQLTAPQLVTLKPAISSDVELNEITPTTKILSPTPTATPSPTVTPSPTASPIDVQGEVIEVTPELEVILNITNTPTPTPTAEAVLIKTQPEPEPPQNSLSSDLIFQLINDHRASLSLPAFEHDEKLCQIAQERAPQLPGEVANGTIHQGFFDMNLPFWATENMAYYSSEQQNMNFWLGSTVHRSAIEGEYKYSCGACHGNACVQIFTNYIAK